MLTWELCFDMLIGFDLTITVDYLPLWPMLRCLDPEFKILFVSGDEAKLLSYLSSSSSYCTAFLIRSRLSCRSLFFFSSSILYYCFSLEPSISSSLSSIPLPPALENREDLKSISSSSLPGFNSSYYLRYLYIISRTVRPSTVLANVFENITSFSWSVISARPRF